MNQAKRTLFVMLLVSVLFIANQAKANSNISQSVNVSTPTIETNVGKTFDLPINISPTLTSSDSVIAYQFEIKYDKNLVKFKEIKTTGSLSTTGIIQYNNDTLGVIIIAYAQTNFMTGSLPLVFITFEALSKGSFTPSLSNFYLNTSAVSSLTSGTIDVLNYTITGNIVSDQGAEIKLGKLYLYKKSGTSIVTVDSVILTTTSTFTLSNIEIGSYTLYFAPDASILRALAIYLGNDPLWANATFFDIGPTSTVFSYTLTIPILPELTGSGIIKGYLNWADSKKSTKNTLGKPVESITIVLRGKQKKNKSTKDDDIIATTTTNESGYFEFTNIPDGSYAISTDMVGVPIIDTPEVIVSQGEAFAADGVTTFDAVNLVVTKDGIEVVGDIFDPVSITNNLSEVGFTVYPNPAKNQFFVNISDASICKSIHIISIDGKTVYVVNNIANKQQINLPASIAPGYYFVRATLNNNSVTKSIIVQ